MSAAINGGSGSGGNKPFDFWPPPPSSPRRGVPVQDGGSEHFPSFADRARASTRHVIKNGLASPTHSAHAAFFRAASSSITKIVADKKAKKVRFYRNGDRFFAGMTYAVSHDRYRTLDSLMAELTLSPICDKVVLPKGVRHIFSLDGTLKVSSLDQLEDGMCYVVSTTAVYRKVDYPVGNSIPNWNANQLQTIDQSQWERSLRAPDVGTGPLMEEDREYIRPKLVTIIRNGSRPRKAVRLLLNKKTAHSFEQVLTEITEAIKLDSGAVKKVFTVTGKQILTLQDFFKEENIFVAYGSEKFSADDFELCSNEIQFVNKSARQQQSVSLKSPRSLRRVMPTSPSSPRRALPLEKGYNPQSPQLNLRKLSPSSRSPVLGRKPFTNGHSNGSCKSDTELTAEPPELRVKYKIGKQIGEGNFAVVKECTEKARKLPFALKVIDTTKCRGQEETIENEVAILRRLKHRNIVQLVEEFRTSSATYLVMELVTGGDLFDSISATLKYTEKDASSTMYNLAQAIAYLHSQQIVHRDIKPENLLVQELADGSKSLKLGDFGLATLAVEPLFTICGTPTYIAPEVLAEIGYGVKVDVWAAGVIMYILLCGFPPFASETYNREELFDKIMAGKYEFLSPFWDDISSSAKELLQGLLMLDATTRLTAEEMLAHPWIADVNSAKDRDIHATVANHIAEFTRNTRKPKPKQPGVAIIAATALDKGSRYFERRKQLQCVTSDAGEVF